MPGGALVWFAGGFAPHDPVEAGLKLLSNGKFLALLTLLFGIGIELQYRRSARSSSCCSSPSPFAGPDWFLVDRYLLPPFVALGLLGLVTTIVLRSPTPPAPQAPPAAIPRRSGW